MIRTALRRVAQRAADGYLEAAGAALGGALAEVAEGRAGYVEAMARAQVRLIVPAVRLAVGVACFALAEAGASRT